MVKNMTAFKPKMRPSIEEILADLESIEEILAALDNSEGESDSDDDDDE
jgi:hypothetical protein